MVLAALHGCSDRLDIGVIDVPMPDLGDGRGIAAAHAGRADNTHILAELAG